MSTAEHRTHGLAGDELVPDWPPLEMPEVQALLAPFPDLRAPFTIAWRSPRPFSAAARVRTGNGEVFVKRHHVSVRRRRDLAPEHALASHLRAAGVPVPEVLADRDGQTAIGRGEWTYEVHAMADGRDLYRDTQAWTPLTDLGRARRMGRMLARVHDAAESFHGAPRGTFVLVSRDDLVRAPDLLAAIAAQAPARPAIAEYLGRRDWRAELAPLAARQRALQPALQAQPRLWTHNDWHGSNLFWSDAADDARITAVLDFGLAAPTFALYDLATAIERNAIAWVHRERGMDAVFPDTARALIAGYADVRPLEQKDRELLAGLLPVVHIDFAVSEIEYFHGVTHSDRHADTAYVTFLIGHAAWFDTPPGQALLNAIAGAP